MCAGPLKGVFGGGPQIAAPSAPILAASSQPARREGDVEARLRRARAGAAADVLTSPEGLSQTFGGV